MLFSKEIQKSCLYCVYGSSFGEREILCEKHGPVSCGYKCRSFKYDPLSRVPPPAVKMTSVPEESLKL